MSSYQVHSRRIVPPGASRKRKEREATLYGLKPPAPTAGPGPSSSPSPKTTASSKAGEPSASSSNRLLAGYMAHEYLTRGTLFGQKYDPARAEAVPVGVGGEPKRVKPEEGKAGADAGAVHESYGEVASMLRTDGAHIPGIVNPTQLARWIQM